MSTTEYVKTIEKCRELAGRARDKGKQIALVPTMGYLHAGHEALLKKACAFGCYTVVTIFVNPSQFGPNEDLGLYPRDLERDSVICAKEGVDLVFLPSSEKELYPEGFQTWINIEGITKGFCGAKRSGHFRGVATIVAKLFNIFEPDYAFFGEKDYQQLVTIRRMAFDLNMKVKIVSVPTVRENDGLAMSSRNAMLTDISRKEAVCIIRGLLKAQQAHAGGERKAGRLVEICRSEVEPYAESIDYIGIAVPESMHMLNAEDRADNHRMLVAAFFKGKNGNVRLIDNAPLFSGNS